VRTLVLIVACAALAWAAPLWAQEEEEADPPQVAIGERLFLETRFAQYFQANSGADVKAPLAAGDPVVATTRTLEDVVRFYVEASRLARAGVLRNGAVELRRMTIDESDVVPLAAFLRALDEDYE
jgi:hypothetical protein